MCFFITFQVMKTFNSINQMFIFQNTEAALKHIPQRNKKQVIRASSKPLCFIINNKKLKLVKL